MNWKKYNLLLSPLFIIGLILLLTNDFFLKAEFHNFLTGKLSDFAGLFIFPFFFAIIFQKKVRQIYILTAILFIFWKSVYSTYFIELFNSLMFFRIGRVVDFTDLFALLVLPISYLYFESQKKIETSDRFNNLKFVASNILIVVSVFAFTATTEERPDEKSVSIKKNYRFFKSIYEIKEKISNNPKVTMISFTGEDSNSKTDSNSENANVETKTETSTFMVHLRIQSKICEAESTRFYFNLVRNNKSKLVRLDLPLAMIPCKAELSNKNIKEAEKIFEDEIINKIMQNNSQ